MSRSLSTAAKIAMHAPDTSQVFLVLLEISHASITTLRFVNDSADVTTGGHTYTAYPFSIELPEESGEQLPRVTLTIDNVSRAITDAILSLTTAPTITMSVVLASSPGTVEAGPFALTLRDITHTAFVVQGALGFERMLEEPYPSATFSPANFPGLF